MIGQSKTPYERFQKHVKDWKDCHKCGLCEQRVHVCLARGKVPCDVLFVGESPGDSEDVLGQPFVGPAGKLLDEMIRRAFPIEPEARLAFTNLVACYPREVRVPVKSELNACQPRLEEFISICRPRLVVCVGSPVTDWLPRTWVEDNNVKCVEVVVPYDILKANQAQQALMIKRVQLALANAYEEVFNDA